jgi:transcriptional regulator with XRE-family HTH domain
MSYFSVALQRQAEKHHLNQSDIGRQCGLSRSFISRLVNGESHGLSDQNIVAILNVFSADPQAQADLIAAQCMDARQVASAGGVPGADLIEIQVRNAAAAETRETELPQVHLSKEAERAFAWLRSQCPLNPELEHHLIGYARLTGMK